MRKNATAKAFVMSVLALMLCLSMLVGTTFAWFTDSVTSGVNKIVAGNLDVELEYQQVSVDEDGTIRYGDWVKVDPTKSLFMPTEGENATLWEPGHTEFVNLRVHNVGTLALKYQLSVSVYGSEDGTLAEQEYTSVLVDEATSENKKFKLSEHLVYSQKEGATEATSREELWLTGDAERAAFGKLDKVGKTETLNPGDHTDLTLVVYMPTWVGNEANYKVGTDAPTIFLGLNLTATQTPKEFDSFDDQYDKDLPLTQITSAEELKSVIENGGSVMVMSNVDAGNVFGFEIKDDTVINGNGNVLTTSTPGNSSTQSRVLDMYNLSNKTLTVSDAVIGGNDETSYPDRGISLSSNTDPVLNIKNSTVQVKSYAICIASGNTNPEVNISHSTVKTESYTVTINPSTPNPKINIEGSTIEGYTAFQTHSGGVTGTFKNSTFKGVNKWSAEGNNNFAVIVVSQNAKEAGTNLTFDNCTISAEEQNTATEYFFSLRQSCTLNLNGCTFVKNGETVSTEDIITDIQTGAGKYVQIYPEIDVTIFVDGVQVK